MARQAKVTHFEVPADNMERAKKFYSEVFGWVMLPGIPGIEYQSITTTPTDERMIPIEKGAINGGLIPRNGQVKHPIITIQVEDIDSALEGVKKHGGKISLKKTVMGDIGFFAYFEDPEGNLMGLWQSARGM